MKTEERKKARDLRREGISINKIADSLGVSKSSVSIWVRDVELSEEQAGELMKRKLSGTNSSSFREKRKAYQQEGRLKASVRDIDHAIGCMLYWGEGSKAKNVVCFTNSDVNTHKTFLLFLRKYFSVENEDVSLRLNCYLDHGLSIEEIYQYWTDQLGLSGCKIGKATIRAPLNSSFSKGRKKSKLRYGVIQLRVCSTQIVQHIFGAIQEYCKFENVGWLG